MLEKKSMEQIQEDDDADEEGGEATSPDPRAMEKQMKMKPVSRLEKYTKTMQEILTLKDIMSGWTICEGIKITALNEVPLRGEQGEGPRRGAPTTRASCPCLALCHNPPVMQVAQEFKLLKAHPGDFVVEEGDEACEAYYCLKGGFNVLVANKKAGSLKPGDGFAECSLIGGKCPLVSPQGVSSVPSQARWPPSL